ncbi:nitroreductase family protein [Peptoniphilus obesi]|uniref:nitroreductase family protein n=1 Tax=Peptoniphilus obesi TaxID=1472765 RepID=UPI0004AEC0BB|nr:nitroreductase family protein [Peptoniphilus obesi]
MVLVDFLQDRRSVRKFKDKKIDKSELERIKGYCKTVEDQVPSVKFFIAENGQTVYDKLLGKAGYGGHMIKAPHYMGLAISEDTDRNNLALGFIIEQMNTQIIEMGYDTCWITIHFVDDETRKAIFGEAGPMIKYLIAFGYREGKKLFEESAVSWRHPLNEICFKDEIGNPASLEDLEERAILETMSSIRFAPSHKNKQPWRFVIKDDCVEIYMVKSDDEVENKDRLVDIGVIMLYFEELIKNINVYDKWTIIFEDQGEYLRVAKFKL